MKSANHGNQPVQNATGIVIQEVAQIVKGLAGIQIGDRQYSMIESRLKSRMVRLKIETFEHYLKYLRENRESESKALVSLMTTHYTYFFREFAHFEFLLERALPQMVLVARKRPDRKIRVLSAACSRGHEVFSLAMFFDHHLRLMAPDIDYEIYGTDIDPQSISFAQNGVYRNEELKQVPAQYLGSHWTRGKGRVQEYSRISSHILSRCFFSEGNLLDYGGYLKERNFDVIFCRNVFIYFNTEQIQKVTRSLLTGLTSTGYLFTGMSEALTGLNLNLDVIGPSIYQKQRLLSETPAPQSQAVERTLEVLCVDDSPTIHALLKKILTVNTGFRIKAFAKNGREALALLQNEKFDVITLDLHMPILDGIGFLTEFKSKSIPVLVISSTNRDDLAIAQKALSLGARDYVEKPSLENLEQAGDEIRAKLKTILGTSAPAEISKLKNASISKTKVLIVDDSKSMRSLLTAIINRDPRLEVIAEVDRPSMAEGAIEKYKPDVLTLDIHMPEMNGVELLKRLHPKYGIPTVIISSISREEGTYVLDALAAGAIDYIEKPQAQDLGQRAHEICDRLAQVAKAQIQSSSFRVQNRQSNASMDLNSLVLIGASTGGTEALKVVLSSLPKQIPPILIVQHIPPVFSAAFAERLNQTCPFPVKEASDGDEVIPNRVLIAPGGAQMGVRLENQRMYIRISDDPSVNRHKPSVDFLFRSVGAVRKKNLVAAILTGMGADGAKELKSLREFGARTIAQDEKSCVVFGMPRAAIELGAAEFICSLEQVGAKIIELSRASEKSNLKKGA